MNRRTSNIGRLIAALLLGAAIGSAVAMFATPRSGMETRQLVREKSVELRERAGEAIDKAREQTSEFLSNARQNATQLMRRDAKKRKRA